LFGKQVGYWMQRAAGGEEITVTFRGRPRVRLVPISPPLLKAA
jgi:prevent-host-death family protein